MKRTFKRTVMGAAAALMLVAPIAAMPSYASAAPFQQNVQFDRNDRNSDYNDHNRGDDQWRDHKWRKGERIPASYRSHFRDVDYRAHHYKAPPRGYHYVQDDRGQTLLVGIATGAILGVMLSH